MSARGFKHPGESCKMHRVKWNDAFTCRASLRTSRCKAASGSAQLAAGDSWATNVHAQTTRHICLHFKSKPEKGELRASMSPYDMLTLLSPFCFPCTGGTWVWGLGWSPPLDTFFLPGPPGMGPSLLAVDRTQLQNHTQQYNPSAEVRWLQVPVCSFASLLFKTQMHHCCDKGLLWKRKVNCPWAAKTSQGSCSGPVDILAARENSSPGLFLCLVSRKELYVHGYYRDTFY